MFDTIIVWLGYLASALIVVSLLCTSMVKLRVVNTIGCIAFVIYGIVIKAYPVAISNGLIVIINLVNLYKMKKGKA
ncbi:YgjV family protein [uncultured Clostridium sp.]|uniref:YgjV family protein n=1 Tax=uncultured Clostridium sp. TaxID=59620 RepID=UPI0026080DE2|nr:YgjV family protein [uncultured Clostridium sp.]